MLFPRENSIRLLRVATAANKFILRSAWHFFSDLIIKYVIVVIVRLSFTYLLSYDWFERSKSREHSFTFTILLSYLWMLP